MANEPVIMQCDDDRDPFTFSEGNQRCWQPIKMLDMHNVRFDLIEESFKASLNGFALERDQKLIDWIRFPADQVRIHPPDRQSFVCIIYLIEFPLEEAIFPAININLMPLV